MCLSYTDEKGFEIPVLSLKSSVPLFIIPDSFEALHEMQVIKCKFKTGTVIYVIQTIYSNFLGPKDFSVIVFVPKLIVIM